MSPASASSSVARVAAVTALLVPLLIGAASAVPPTSPRPTHIIVIVQENRTFDNLFNGFPGADSRRYGYDSHGNVVPLQQRSLHTNYDLDHSHRGFETEWRDGALNGFDLVRTSGIGAKQPDLAYSYAPYSEVKPYWDLARQYVLADAFFQTNEGPSFPAHQYLIAGQSGHFSATSPDPLDPAARGPLALSENIAAPGTNAAGCDSALSGYLDTTIDLSLATNPQPSSEQTPHVAPCANYPTILDELSAAALSWRYYTPSYGVLWDAPDAIAHIRFFPRRWANVRVPETSIFDDLASHTLANVSYVIPRGTLSDHPGGTTRFGPDWVASVINAVGESSYWRNTAIIVTWDDWGGFYDHVKPKIINAYSDGFRVPALIVSPYARAGYVSHRQRDFGSILNAIEANFGLASLAQTDSYNDDLGECFDFSQRARPFHPIATTAGFNAAALRRLPPDNSPVDDN